MKDFEEIMGEATIIRLAEQNQVPREEIEAQIQQIIETTWAGHDPASRAARQRIFRGKKPSPALFIGRLAEHARKTQNTPDG